MPVGSEDWPPELRELFISRRAPGAWRSIYSGVVAGNGRLGDDEDPSVIAKYRAAFSEPRSYERVHQAGLYDNGGFCDECDAPFCAGHWNVNSAGFGSCPSGPRRGLEPHWSPAD